MGNNKNTVKRLKICDTKKDLLKAKIPDKPVTVSYSKLPDSDNNDNNSDFDSDDEFEVEGNGFRLWEWGQLQTLISKVCACKKCSGSMDLVEDSSDRKGWCSKIGLKCSKCFCVEYVTTSPMQGHSAAVNIIELNFFTNAFSCCPGIADFFSFLFLVSLHLAIIQAYKSLKL